MAAAQAHDRCRPRRAVAVKPPRGGSSASVAARRRRRRAAALMVRAKAAVRGFTADPFFAPLRRSTWRRGCGLRIGCRGLPILPSPHASAAGRHWASRLPTGQVSSQRRPFGRRARTPSASLPTAWLRRLLVSTLGLRSVQTLPSGLACRQARFRPRDDRLSSARRRRDLRWQGQRPFSRRPSE